MGEKKMSFRQPVELRCPSKYAGIVKGDSEHMPRPPNYNQERLERDRAKAKKKADKLAAKAEAKERNASQTEVQTEVDDKDD